MQVFCFDCVGTIALPGDAPYCTSYRSVRYIETVGNTAVEAEKLCVSRAREEFTIGLISPSFLGN